MQGILILIVDAELIVQVRAGGKAGRTNECDDLSLRHMLTLVQALCKPGQVTVPCGVFRLMSQNQQIAIAAMASDEIYSAIGRGLDPRAGRCTVVYPGVRAPALQYRMKSRQG